MEKILKWYPKSSKCRIYFSLETYWDPWWLGSAPFQRDGSRSRRGSPVCLSNFSNAHWTAVRDSPEIGDKKTWTVMAIYQL